MIGAAEVAGPELSGGHAICTIGYVDLPSRPELGDGRFILRNSWGLQWGANSPHGAGNGTVPYIYIARSCMEAFAVS